MDDRALIIIVTMITIVIMIICHDHTDDDVTPMILYVAIISIAVVISIL